MTNETDMTGGLTMDTSAAPGAGGNLTHDNSTNQPVDHSKAFWKSIKSMGADAGEGSTALVRLALATVRAANDGIISAEKRTGSKDDAALIYEAYMSENSKKAGEFSAGGAKANASKLRQVIQMGSMTTCDPVDVFDRAVEFHKELQKDEGVKLKALYPALVDVAREQLATDVDLTSDQIKDAIVAVPRDKTVEAELKAIQKKVENLIEGNGGLKHDTPEMQQIKELVAAQITTFGVAKERGAFITMALGRGYTQAQAEILADGGSLPQ